jgi:hypothetical protein
MRGHLEFWYKVPNWTILSIIKLSSITDIKEGQRTIVLQTLAVCSMNLVTKCYDKKKNLKYVFN